MQEDEFTELLAAPHKEFTNEALLELDPRERMKRDKREKKVSGEIHDSRNGEESFFI